MKMVIMFTSLLILFSSFNGFNIYNMNKEKILTTFLQLHHYLNRSSYRSYYQMCYSESFKLFKRDSNYLKTNPRLLSSIGKGMDDMGNELECLETNLNLNYTFLKYNFKDENETFQFYDLAVYLNRTYSFLGICFPKNCSKIILKVKNLTDNDVPGIDELKENLKFYYPKSKDSYLFEGLFWTFIFFIVIKISVGIYSSNKFSKGYYYHGYNLYLKMPDNVIEDEEKEKEKEKEKLISETLLNQNDLIKNNENVLKGEYNPIYDFEPFYPMYFRMIKYLDLFNNISIFFKKRNRYYNENDISILCSIKAFVLFFVIFNETVRVLIVLPNPSVFNYKFYKNLGLSIYKYGTNAYIFWAILESATFSFKLMKFIHKNISKNKKFKNKSALVLKQCLKFLCFYIPKIIIYIFIYVFFYYLSEKYTCKFSSKTIYYYTYTTEIQTKKCNKVDNFFKEFIYAIIPFLNYKYNHSEIYTYYQEVCFPFTYLCSNMFFSSLFFMLILIFISYIKNKILDIILFLIAILNLIINYVFYFIKDNKFNDHTQENEDEDEEIYRFFNHYSGEVYSIFYPHIFFSFYFFGCLLGFCLYYYSQYSILQKNNYKNNQMNTKNYKVVKENGGDENNPSGRISIVSQNTNNRNSNLNEENISYIPMGFCYTFIIKLKKMKIWIKILLINIFILLSAFLCTINNILILYYTNKGDDIENNFDFKVDSKFHPFKLLFFFEKIFNVFLFIITICFLLVLPKDYLLIRIMNSHVFLSISRAGLFTICLHESFIYISYSLFQLEIHIGFFMVSYIVLGLYILIIFLSVLGTILIELPFRIIFKNLLKGDENDESRMMLIHMKNSD